MALLIPLMRRIERWPRASGQARKRIRAKAEERFTQTCASSPVCIVQQRPSHAYQIELVTQETLEQRREVGLCNGLRPGHRVIEALIDSDAADGHRQLACHL